MGKIRKFRVFLGIFCIALLVVLFRNLKFHFAISENKSQTRIINIKRQQQTDWCKNGQCVPSAVVVKWAAMYNKAPKYKIANCAIQKSLSTLTMAIICYLYDEEKFERANRTLAGEADWFHRGCRSNNRWVVDINLLHNSEWLHFAVVREPIERFLSGWMDKCYNLPTTNKAVKRNPTWCYGCKRNLSCFVQRNYISNLQFPRRYKPKYKIVNLEDHFWPQNWFCNFTKYFDQYTILKYSHDKAKADDMFAKLRQLFRQQHVEETLITKIIRQATASRPQHATLGQNATEYHRNLLLNDKKLMSTLIRTYYYDFVMFSFPIPQL